MTAMIAFCGIDGSGKSSIISKVRESGAFSKAKYLKKLNQDNLALVKKYHFRRFNSGLDWIDSEFAQSAAVATCLDFMHYYDQEVAPLIGEKDYIFFDRYSLCYSAYLKATGSKFDADNLFRSIKMPTLLFFIDVPIDVAVTRHHKRGGPSEDEHPAVMQKFREAYLELLDGWQSRLVIIDNTRSLDKVFDEVMREISNLN
jgi:thymidylate kinase